MVLKPTHLTPLSILLLIKIINNLLPPNIINIINNTNKIINKYLTTSKHITKITFTNSTKINQQIIQYTTQNIIPITLKLNNKSPNIFFTNIINKKNTFFNKTLKNFTLFTFNQNKIYTYPNHTLIQKSIYKHFIKHTIHHIKNIHNNNPLNNVTQINTQISHKQLKTILNYININKKKNTNVLTNKQHKLLKNKLKNNYYLKPTILFNQNNIQIFQKKIFNPILTITTFKTIKKALKLTNNTQYNLNTNI